MSYEIDVSEILKNLFSLNGNIDSLRKRSEEIQDHVSQSKRFVDIQPDIGLVLTELQQKAHERSVGVYEKLLTAILHDVLGESTRKVSMDLEIKRGVPSLEINIDHNGEKESIMDGQGGSVANIISAGLRFVVLSRLSDNRKFIVMDEPDCWLSPDKVPAFFNVLSKLSKDAGIQVLVISHHNTKLFGEVGIVELVNHDGKGSIKPEVVKQGNEWSDDSDGIRSIRLINFMSHEFTQIDLDPNVTVVCGENNLGKSAVVSALRGVFFNEGKDHMVRHGEKEAIVEIAAEDGAIVRWTRKNKGSNRTKYELINSDFHLLHEEFNGNEVPSWADSILRVRKEHDIDVHIGRQKLPLFMIGEKASKCAEILSMGKESRYLHAMLSENKTQSLQHKRSSKLGEEEFGLIHTILNNEDVSGISSLIEEGDKLLKIGKELDFHPSENELLLSYANKLENLESVYSQCDQDSIQSILLPEKPVFHNDNDKLRGYLSSINTSINLSNAKNILNTLVVPEAPVILETENLLDYGRKLFAMEKSLDDVSSVSKKDFEIIHPSELKDTKSILKTGIALRSIHDFVEKSLATIKQDEVELALIIEELESFEACPLCGSDLEVEHNHSMNDNNGLLNRPSFK